MGFVCYCINNKIRFIIIENIEDLNLNSANALLKSIEESGTHDFKPRSTANKSILAVSKYVRIFVLFPNNNLIILGSSGSDGVSGSGLCNEIGTSLLKS